MTTRHQIKRLLIAVAGGTVLALGLALTVLSGPALLFLLTLAIGLLARCHRPLLVVRPPAP